MSFLVRENIQLKSYNTMSLPCVARYFSILISDSDFSAAITFALNRQLPICVLGSGSNVILTRDYPGLVVLVANKGIHIVEEDDNEVVVRVGAGEIWDDFLQYCIKHRWYGLENLAIIPGTVGAAPIQNVGAYGQEVADCIDEVSIVDITNNVVRTLGKAMCEFAYRDSIFKRQLKNKCIITAVQFRLQKTFKPNLSYGVLAETLDSKSVAVQQLRQAVIDIRQSKLPAPSRLANCGSFFKNPVVSMEKYRQLTVLYPQMPAFIQADDTVKLAAGWLIEQAKWKGRRLGCVGMYDKQALVLVNYGGASYADLRQLVKSVQQDVWQLFGVQLEQEPIQV